MAGDEADEGCDQLDNTSMQVIFQDEKNVTSKVSLLDGVLSSFFHSNNHRGERYSFKDLFTQTT